MIAPGSLAAPRRGRIAVAGGSVAGLFAAVLLRRSGWDVRVFERSEGQLASRGAGITTHAELYAAFAQAGIALDGALGVESLERVTFDRAGRAIGRLPMRQTMTSWSMLYRLLRERCPSADYAGGSSVCGVQDTADGVDLQFADGGRRHADYVIAADGLRSTLRGRLLPESTLEYAGYVAWRGLADERDLPPAVLAALEGRMAFCLPPGEQMLGYLVAGPQDSLRPGERWYNWVWYRPAPADGALPDLLTDAQGRLHAQGIPPPLLREAHVAALREAAARTLCPQFAAVVAATAQPFIQPIWDVCAPRLRLGRVLLVGDAACTARPHIGLGVSKAADDAASLARALAAPPAERDGALAAWEASRLRFARAALRQSRRLGSYIGGRDDAVARHYREPLQVMTQVAAAEPGRHLEYDDA